LLITVFVFIGFVKAAVVVVVLVVVVAVESKLLVRLLAAGDGVDVGEQAALVVCA
jgi:hypothetical protein